MMHGDDDFGVGAGGHSSGLGGEMQIGRQFH